MVQVVVEEVDSEQVIRFGSRTRGDEQEDSDVDRVGIERRVRNSARKLRGCTVQEIGRAHV